MSKSINSRSKSLRTPFTSALLGGLLVLGACGDFQSGPPEETGSLEQALQPSAPGADVWRANLGVSLTATKDPVAKTITYVFTTANYGDDDARSVLIAVAFPPGITVTSTDKGVFDSCSAVAITGAGSNYFQCSRTSLGVRGTALLTVTVSNPTNAASQASAQVHNLSPDPITSNNYAQLSVP